MNYYFLDRNAISFLRQWRYGTLGGNSARFWTLKRLDRSSNMISAMLSVWEGGRARIETAEEKTNTAQRDAEALGRFFRRAKTDQGFFTEHSEHAGTSLAGESEHKFAAYLELVRFVQTQLYQPLAPAARKPMQAEILALADRLNIDRCHPIVICALAQLYGSPDTVDVFKAKAKLKNPDWAAHNALIDLLSISRLAQIAASLNEVFQAHEYTIQLVSFDPGIVRVVTQLGLTRASARQLDGGDAGRCVGSYTPQATLFPKLDQAQFETLLLELGGTRNPAA